jgi:acyl phosphate:glycerol-3-phosphate acyltransferase
MHYYAMILLLIGGYLFGSIPAAYIAGRLLKGIDIRNYGSGIASGSNVWHSISKWAIIPVGAFDLLKGVAPVLIAMQLHLTVNGSGVAAQGIVALAAMIGHSWSIFFKFHGGRGVTPMLGALGVMTPWGLIIFVALWVGGLAAFKNSPLWMLAGMLAAIISAPFIPTSVALMSSEEPRMMMWILIGMLLLLIIKRITAERPIPKENWKEVLLCRLIYDRDTRSREAWIYRKPADGDQSGQK